MKKNYQFKKLAKKNIYILIKRLRMKFERKKPMKDEIVKKKTKK